MGFTFSKVRPIGSAPSKKVFTKVWLTMALPGKESVELKSRPSVSRIFMVLSHPGEMERKIPHVSVTGAALTEMEPLQPSEGERSGQLAMATSLTPGTARSVSAICDQASADCPCGVTVW